MSLSLPLPSVFHALAPPLSPADSITMPMTRYRLLNLATAPASPWVFPLILLHGLDDEPLQDLRHRNGSQTGREMDGITL
jgi:hypothetical protein